MRKLSDKHAGIYFGVKKGCMNSFLRLCGVNRDVIKPQNEDGHVAIFGGSGSGKSACNVIPTITQTWTDPFVAIDIKGELFREYERKPDKRKTKVFSLRTEAGCSYDPFDFIHKNGKENFVANIQELVNALLPLPINIPDQFWIESARIFLTAGMLYYFKMGMGFIDSIINIMTTPPNAMIEEIIDDGDIEAEIFLNNFVVKYVDPDAGEIKCKTISDSKMLLGIGQEITNRLSIFATDPRIRKALVPSENQLRWEDLDICNIFISVPEDRLEQYSGVLIMLLTQLIRTLERRPEKHSPKGEQMQPVLLMLDEFPRLGRVEVITSAVSTLRSKKVTICLVMQSLAQLDAIYGEKIRRIILDNCSYIAIFSVIDAETQRYFSELIGTIPVERKINGTNYDVKKKETGYSEQTSEVHEPVIRPHEFATMKDVALLTPEGFQRVKKVPYYEKPIQQRIKGFFGKLWSSVIKTVDKVASRFVKTPVW